MGDAKSSLGAFQALHVHSGIIKSVRFLRELDTCEVALLVEKMKPTIACPGEDVVEEDRFGREMYRPRFAVHTRDA